MLYKIPEDVKKKALDCLRNWWTFKELRSKFWISEKTYYRRRKKEWIKPQTNLSLKYTNRDRYDKIYDFIKNWWKKKETINEFSIWQSTYYNIKEEVERDCNIEQKEKYEYADWKYTINSRDQYGNKKQYVFDISFIDELFFKYTNNGANMTSQQCINWMREEYNYWQREFDIIKNTLWLQKYSDAVSPVSLSLSETKERLDDLALEITNKANEHKYFMSFKKAHPKSLQNIMQKWGRILASYSDLFDFYKEYLDWWKPWEYNIIERNIETNDKLFVWIADMHIGRETNVVKDRLWQVLSFLCEKKESDIVIFDLWDELETIIPDWMHTSQILEMDLLWIEQLSEWVKITANFLSLLAKHKNVVYNIVTKSNHMRVDKEHNRDPQRIAWYVFAYLLQKEAEIMSMNWYNVTVNIVNDKIWLYKDWSYNFILSHWDDWFNKKKSLDILWNNSPSVWYNIVLSWDWHTSFIEQGKNYTRARIPSLNNPWQYAKDNSLCHQPWYIIISNNWWLPTTSFIPLH